MAAKRESESVPLSRFGVLVAQLESIAASARQQPPDPLLCFDLLSELVTSIEEESKESIVQWQRKCEDALYSLLILGARRPVRRLASLAMVRVIAKGDGISIYSRASTLQGWLTDGKRSEPLSCAGAAQCLGELYRLFGRRITSGLIETANIAAKLMKFHEDFVRQDALQMLENALDGSGGSGSTTAYSEAFRIIMRVGVGDKSFIVRLAAARCLKTFASIGGPGLGITEFENSISYCLKALEDPVSSVRDAFAEALGALVALAMNPEAQVTQRGKNHPIPAKKLEGGLQKHLVMPFTRASGIRAKDLRIGLALSWVFYLQVIRLKYHLPDSELQNFALQAMDMLHGNPSTDAHALACVLYIIRVGVADQMTEPTQRSFLVLLGRKLESGDYSPPVGVATLRILSYLLTTLGEVPVEFKEVLDDTVVAALSHSSLHVRTEAALTWRALAEVDPTCVGGLVSYGVTTLHALRESASIEKGNRLKLELDSLHGQAAVLAALVSISPRLLLGYPARLPKSVFEVSKKMLTEFSRNLVAVTVEKEAGWLLLSSLIASMPKEELEDQIFDVLLLWAGPFGGNPESRIKQTQDLTSELRVLSAAVEALTAFIKSFVSPAVTATNGGIFLQPVLVYLSGALSFISSLAAKQLQNMKPAVDLFTIRTLMAYQALSNPMAYKSEHPQIIQICTTPFRDWFEDELRAFDGGKDGLLPCVWDDQILSFPQPESISKMLVNQMLLCFGSIFATQDNGGKLILLHMIDQCLKTGKKQSWHVASVTNACVGLLAGLKTVLALRLQTLGVDILSSIQAIFQGILAEGEICAAQRRASAEGLGLLARLGNDIFTARMTRSLLGELVAVTDTYYVGSIALALGCIHRSAGGMALSSLVPATVSSTSLLAKSSNAGLQLWSLHALLLTIEAAGLSFVSQVQATLFLVMEILLLEDNGWVDLRQEIGRLVNAIVAVLGPELAPGSTFFSRCKSVVAETSSGQETSTLLESVRFTQQLVLFAPQAVSVHSQVQTLLPTLSSRQPSLRHLAVSTLRHLIEKDPIAMIDEKVEESLFSMLDEETDTEIGSLVRATITRLLNTSCPSFPSRWLVICRNMALATSTRRNGAENRTSSENDHLNGTSKGDATLSYGEDDEDMIASSNGEQMQSSVSVSSVNPKRDKHLRYRTRVFAAECLSYLPTAVGTDPTHFDLSLARRQPAKGHADWLVLHLQDLVSLAYQISTSQFEGMQHIGARLLSTIVDKFEKIPDPEFPTHLLLEQYQAQFVSAVRSAINTSSGPLLLDAGLQLATKILTSSILSGDRVALNRMFSLISRSLNEIKDLYYPSFAEWVACKIKIRLLAAHASIKCYVYSFLREQKSLTDEYLQLIPLFSSSSSTLGKYWICLLKDYSYICFSLQSKFNYKPFLDGIQSSLVSSKVQTCLDETWPLILQATALDAVPVKFEMEKSSDNYVESLPKSVFISGYSMVRLETREFNFLWGLALLVLYQGQQSGVGKQVKPLLGRTKMNNIGDSMLKETHGLTSSEIALLVFQSLSTKVFFSLEFLTLNLCTELLQVLIYTDHVADSWNNLVVHLLSQIVQFCPDGFFEMEDFTCAANELCIKYLYRAFQSDNSISHEHPTGKDLVSTLAIVAETIACRMNHKKKWKLIMALMSICYERFRGASTDLCLSKVISFLWNIVPFLKKCFREETELGTDDFSHLETAFGAWASLLTFLSQECIKRIHCVENKISDSCRLLIKMLTFCLEEAVSLSRLIHGTQHLRQRKDDSQMFLFSVYRHCTKCLQDTLSDGNIQVQTVGLHVLKSVAQREHAEDSHVKSHSFLMFFAGELFGDIFFLIQDTLKKPMSRETIAVTEECLRLLFLLHTLSQATECLQAVIKLLLEAMLMVSSAYDESQSQELNEVKIIARRLVSHLVQIPSSAIQIKDVILSMPATRRQQLQDMIRASVTQGQMTTQVKSMNPPPINKLNLQTEAGSREDQLHASDIPVTNPDKPGIKEEADDDDEDWDAFQSLPASSSTSASTINLQADKTGIEPASVGDSSAKESDYDYKNDSHHHGIQHKMSEEITDALHPETGTNEAVTNLDGNELQEPSDRQPCEDIGAPLKDDEKLMEEQPQEVHVEVVIRNQGDEDGSHKNSDDLITAPIDDEKESDGQHLYLEGGDESVSEVYGDDLQTLSDGMHAPPKDSEKKTEGQHLEKIGEEEAERT